MNKALADEILRNIELSGTADTLEKPIIGGHLNHILNLSSGSPRIQTNVIKKFSLIIAQPRDTKVLNPFEIRCCLCHRVIAYPCWYYSIRYAVNHFHYFICASEQSMREQKPLTACYRRD